MHAPLILTLRHAQEWFKDILTGEELWELPDGAVVEGEVVSQPRTPPQRMFRRVREGSAEWFVDPDSGETVWELPADGGISNDDSDLAAPTEPAAVAPSSWWLTVRDGDDVWFVHPKTRELVWELPTGAVGVEGIYETYNDADGSTYYKNKETGRTEWELPPGCVLDDTGGW